MPRLHGSTFLEKNPRPQGSTAPGELKAGEGEELKGLLGLPEEETEIDVRGYNLCLPLWDLSRVLKKVWIQRGIRLFFAKTPECVQLQAPHAFAKEKLYFLESDKASD